jgi:ADP-ribose pyrophosphatase YjhB (NUDIX family)
MGIKIKVLGLVYNSRDEILMLREKTEKNDKAKWNFVRGTYETAGENLDECMLRELREETGIEELDSMERVDLLEFYQKDKTRIYFVYKICLGEFSKSLDITSNKQMLDENIVEHKWCELKTILNMKEEMWVDEIIGEISKILESLP